MFICALVDLFDKAVAEGARPNTVKTRSEPCDETKKYRYKHIQEPSHNSIALVGGPPGPCRPNSEKPVAGNKCYVQTKDIIIHPLTEYLSNDINQCGTTSCHTCNILMMNLSKVI